MRLIYSKYFLVAFNIFFYFFSLQELVRLDLSECSIETIAEKAFVGWAEFVTTNFKVNFDQEQLT